MSKEIKNKAVELSDEETVKASGGLIGKNQKPAYCEKCNVYYTYTVDASGKIPPHKCASSTAVSKNPYMSME